MHVHCVGCRISHSVSCEDVTKRRLLIRFQYLLYVGKHPPVSIASAFNTGPIHNSPRSHTEHQLV
jgi:hypothetical protein